MNIKKLKYIIILHFNMDIPHESIAFFYCTSGFKHSLFGSDLITFTVFLCFDFHQLIVFSTYSLFNWM